MLEEERIKTQFFSSMVAEIRFEYSTVPSMLTISDWGSEQLGIPRLIMNPSENEKLLSIFSLEEMRQLDQKLRNTTPDCPILECEIEWKMSGKTKFSWIICRALWTQDEKKEYSGAIGKIVDIQEEKHELERLQKLAVLDPLTHLLNAVSAEKKIKKILDTHPENEYALIILDLDYFKVVNSVC